MSGGPWTSVLIITADSCGGWRQCRLPKVTFNPEMGINVNFCDKDAFGLHDFRDPSILPLFEWTKVQIAQETECGQIVHRVIINGVEKYKKEVEEARKITNLDLNLASSYFPKPERGYIKGLTIQIKEENERIFHREL